MLMDDYQRDAATTARYPDDIGLAYVGLGLTGEAGEIANKIKKVYRDHEGELSFDARFQLQGELGDALWYCAMLATELDISLSMVAQRNLDKLASRAERDAIRGSGDDR
jgi:NTP pyrophosphatase (non-canonical NTP hydrolase)